MNFSDRLRAQTPGPGHMPSPVVQNKAVQFDDQPSIAPTSSSGSNSNRRERHRDRANSISGDHHRQSSSRRHNSSRKERSQSLSRTGRAGSDSDETIILPDRFDKYGRPKENVDARIGDRIESILNGRAAGNFFKRIFND